MTRIQPNLNPDTSSQEQLAKVQAMLGSTPNVFTTLANSPAVLNFYLSGATALNNTAISGALREQIALTVAGANSCDYCASAHSFFGKMHKIPDDELTHNLNSRSTDPKTQAALTFARKIVDRRGNISNGDLEDIRSAGFSETEIVEIVAVVCLNIFTNYFNHIADPEIDFPKVSTSDVDKAA